MIVVIPARFASTRLPGKALLDLKGKSLIQRVYECAQQSRANRIIIATDDERIEQAARDFGAEVCMTSASHSSGTERLAEVIELLRISGDEVVVNLQGDEPLMPGSLINQVGDTLEESKAPMATACHEVDSLEEVGNPHVVKVVTDAEGYALYFSRSAIPFVRDNPQPGKLMPKTFYRHIGIYAYRAEFMKRYVAWPACPIEQHESLEQLRVLWHGERIAVCEANEMPGPGIDTPEDLQRVLAILNKKSRV
jgi:3-deoxy-manno-octulosonate cytidylyltransferase (CMP-KDO synthetase)